MNSNTINTNNNSSNTNTNINNNNNYRFLKHLDTLEQIPSTQFTDEAKLKTLQLLHCTNSNSFLYQQNMYQMWYGDDAECAARQWNFNSNHRMMMMGNDNDKHSMNQELFMDGLRSRKQGRRFGMELGQRLERIRHDCLNQQQQQDNSVKDNQNVVESFHSASASTVMNSRRAPPPRQSLSTSTTNMSMPSSSLSSKNLNRTWEQCEAIAVQNKRNDFQTALEFRCNEPDQDEMDGRNSNEFSKGRQQQHNNNNRASNESKNSNSSTSNNVPAGDIASCISAPQRTFGLSEGLKRKFQPPMRSNSHPSGSNGGTLSRPSSSHSNNGKIDEEEDLPEGLRGLDKDLIEKIKNEIVDSGDPITFGDIAGLEAAKQTVMELVCWPMKRPDLFTGLRRGPNGLLLFGPPGTGKTLIGKAIAHESGATFFSISSSSLTSKWIGEGEKLVRTLFAVAAVSEPAVVFIDEIDSLLTARKADENEASRRIKTEFLVQLDGTGTSGQGRLLCIGATNRPHELDDAARRRFVKRLYIPLPETSDREILLRTLLKKNSHSLSSEDIQRLAEDTDGYSGADLKALCTDAALGPIRQLGARALMIDIKDVPPISYRHFRQALRGMNPSVAQSDLEIYLKWNDTYGSKSAFSDENDMSDDDS